MDSIKPYCPTCGWQPDGKAHWKCECGHQWNSFDTVGRCPCCKKNWEFTQCVEDAGGCNDFARHEDWYPELNGIVKELAQELQIST
jgi:hypothetical protein